MPAHDCYPKPGPVGGRLIRRALADLRKAGLELPIDSDILIAVSGGSDSLALAHLLLKYGRRIVDPSRVRLLHVNHGWRGDASDADAEFVREFGAGWGVSVLTHVLAPVDAKPIRGESPENVARLARKAIFELEASRHKALVLTAHQADDTAETLLWRLFTGAAQTHGGAIAVRAGVEVRPLLGARKSELQDYLREEGQSWREDATNHDGRLLRSQMRQELMPVIEKLYPRAVEHLVDLAAQAQRRESSGGADSGRVALGHLFDASGLRVRRAHWAAIDRNLQQGSRASMDLPNGWRLVHQPGKRKRWILEAFEEISDN